MLMNASPVKSSAISQLIKRVKPLQGPGMKIGSTQPDADSMAQAEKGMSKPSSANIQYWLRDNWPAMRQMPGRAGCEEVSDMRAPVVEETKQERTVQHTISSRAFVPPWSRNDRGRQLSDQTAPQHVAPGTLAV